MTSVAPFKTCSFLKFWHKSSIQTEVYGSGAIINKKNWTWKLEEKWGNAMNTNDVLNGWKNLGSSLKMIQQKIFHFWKNPRWLFITKSLRIAPWNLHHLTMTMPFQVWNMIMCTMNCSKHFQCFIHNIILQAGANPRLKDQAGRNALHWAAHHGHVKCLKTLLNSKSTPKWNERDNVSHTYLNFILSDLSPLRFVTL